MKPYASYKPSGVPWLGDVPAHWAGKRLRDCVEGCCNGVWGDDPDGGDDDIPVIRVADFDRAGRQVVEYETLRKVDSGQRGSRALVPGDMLMEKSGGGEQQPVGMVVSYLGPKGAVCSNFVARMRSREGVVSRFMVYLHAYLYASRVTNISVKQTTGIQNLDSTAYLSEACFVPPPDEQQAIADHLDVETARIDTLIQEKDELIGLLKEWRQSVIAEVVTKGVEKAEVLNLHPDPWIGLYPAHWEIKKLKHMGMFRAGAGFPVELQGQVGNPLPFFKVKDIDGANKNGVIRETDSTVTHETAAALGAKVFPPEAVVFAKVGAALLLNRFRLLGVESCIDNNMMGFVLDREAAYPRFMLWAMQRINFSEIVNPGTVPSLNEPLISNLQIAVPAPDEQQAIADYLDTETAKIDDLIAHTNDEITLLKELRAAAIADAVLGRIDVRASEKTIATSA